VRRALAEQRQVAAPSAATLQQRQYRRVPQRRAAMLMPRPRPRAQVQVRWAQQPARWTAQLRRAR
jgi:hypothetical protein